MPQASTKSRVGSGAFAGARGFATRFHWDSDALNYINTIQNAGAQLSTPIKRAINTFYITLKTYNIWNKLEIFYPFIGGTAATHAVNGKTPGTYNITWNGTGIVHSYKGVKGGGGSTNYGNTGWAPNAATIMSQNSVSIGVYYNSVPTSGSDFGSSTGTAITNGGGLYMGTFTTSMYSIVNNNVVDGVVNPQNIRPGLTVARRIISTNIQGFKNGAQISTHNITSRAPIGVNAYVAAVNFNGTASGSTNTISFAFIASGDVDQRNLADALNVLQAKLGRAYV